MWTQSCAAHILRSHVCAVLRRDGEGLRMNRHIVTLAICTVLLGAGVRAGAQPDPLSSWNDGAAKQAIVEFVKGTTTEGNQKFVPPAERIATFDQDGTLWVEHPIYTQ